MNERKCFNHQIMLFFKPRKLCLVKLWLMTVTQSQTYRVILLSLPHLEVRGHGLLHNNKPGGNRAHISGSRTPGSSPGPVSVTLSCHYGCDVYDDLIEKSLRRCKKKKKASGTVTVCENELCLIEKLEMHVFACKKQKRKRSLQGKSSSLNLCLMSNNSV